MCDFSHKSYIEYIEILKMRGFNFIRFDDFIASDNIETPYCLIRHDVDRKPKRALEMAILENKLGIKSTYYFRTKTNTFNLKIIKTISDLGHEIGYHYESLSDKKGNMNDAIADFEDNLYKLRKIVSVKTCSMHGKPLSKYDNRDIWKIKENHEYLKIKLGVIGEVYLDINYSEIAYINDTGRNWTTECSNFRDRIESTIQPDLKNKNDLLNYLLRSDINKVCFQIHPERWTRSLIGYLQQYFFDLFANGVKYILKQYFFYGSNQINRIKKTG